MTTMLDTFTEREQKLARGMAAAIWGIDLDAVEQLPTERDGAVIPVWPPTPPGLVWREETESLEPFLTPRFDAVTILLDRWLVPWKLKAGYSERINTLVYRVEVT